MTEEQPRRRRGLVGFYIGAGVFIALAVVAAFTWRPLTARHYQWQIERKTPVAKGAPEASPVVKGRLLKVQVVHVLLVLDPSLPAWEEANSLAGLGPAAGPAFRRLLGSENGNVRDLATIALTARRATWALPMLVELAGDKDEAVAWQALITAGLLTEQGFVEIPMATVGGGPSLPAARRKLLDWWEAEGRAKYGGGE